MFNNLKKIALNSTIASAVAFAGFAGTSAQAASDGTLGATSTGTVGISASVTARARITGLADVTFAPTDLTIAASNAQNVCVWSNTSTKGYNVIATGSGASSAFTLANGALTVPYSVEWNAAASQTTGAALTTGSVSANLVSTAADQTCTAGETQSLIIGISSADLGSMTAAANYTGTLTLVVSPV